MHTMQATLAATLDSAAALDTTLAVLRQAQANQTADLLQWILTRAQAMAETTKQHYHEMQQHQSKQQQGEEAAVGKGSGTSGGGVGGGGDSNEWLAMKERLDKQ